MRVSRLGVIAVVCFCVGCGPVAVVGGGVTVGVLLGDDDSSGGSSRGQTSTPSPSPTPGQPTSQASPASGNYTAAIEVVLTANPIGSTIYYTRDGSTPTTASTVFAGSISISSDTTLRFFARNSQGVDGVVTTETYTFGSPTVPAPTIQSILPVLGPIAGGTAVQITGTNFQAGLVVTVGGVPLESVVVQNSSTISGVTSTSIAVGAVDVLVTGGNGTGTLPGSFEYRLGLGLSGAALGLVGAQPVQNAVADFNGDGSQDIVVALRSGAVALIRGDGAGGFQTPVLTALGSQPFGLVAGDLTKNGKLDLVVCDLAVHKIYVLHGDGAGNFALQAPQYGGAADPFPEYMSLGDFGNDGNLDVVVPIFGSPTGNVPSVLNVFTGNGAGSFNAAPTAYGVANGPQLTALGDVDGDGQVDVFNSHAQSNGFHYLRGKGDGTFETPQFVDVGARPSSVEGADFKKLGRDQVFTTHPNRSPQLTTRNAGGTFQVEAVPSALVGHHLRTQVFDLNRDGYPDLVAGIHPSDPKTGIAVFLNNRQGNFKEHIIELPNAPNSLAPVDADKDGRMDLVIMTNNELLVYLNK
jgi:chitobiase/beta-hexosaminidase-like protein/VCBS repeat protein/IPT/TIG domain-containing protein